MEGFAMIVLICPLVGAAIGGAIGVLWHGLALVFGLPPPTSDQMQGLIMVFGVVTPVGVGGTVAWLLINDGA